MLHAAVGSLHSPDCDTERIIGANFVTRGFGVGAAGSIWFITVAEL